MNSENPSLDRYAKIIDELVYCANNKQPILLLAHQADAILTMLTETCMPNDCPVRQCSLKQ